MAPIKSQRGVRVMASANWSKSTTQKAGAMKKHLNQADRERCNHSNEHIDKSFTHTNYAIGCEDYSAALRSMKDRTKDVDAIKPPKRIRKDRVTCCFIEIPCPNTLSEQGKADEFFKSAHNVLVSFFGAENVHGSFVHKDEKHAYVDKNGTSRMSLEHMHSLVSAYTDEKGINGKAFETKTRLKSLNKALDDMCLSVYKVPFNTGETPEKKSVERLKCETELREETLALETKLSNKKKEFDDLSREVQWASEIKKLRTSTENIDLVEKYPVLRRDRVEVRNLDGLETIKQQATAYCAYAPQIDRLDEKQKVIDSREKELDVREKNVENREQAAESKMKRAELKYNSQLDLNEKYNNAVKKWFNQAQTMTELKKSLIDNENKTDALAETLKNAVKAIGTLYADDNLTFAQKNLIKAISDYSLKRAEDCQCKSMVDDMMSKEVCRDIQDYMQPLLSRKRTRNRGDMSL